MNKRMITYTRLFFILFTLSFLACKNQEEDTKPEEENELLTTVKLSFIDTLSGDTFDYAWRQPAGPGTQISVDTIYLAKGKYYKASTEVLDESKSPVVNHTEDIRTLANEHRFFYTSNLPSLLIKVLDFDQQSPPMELGLAFEVDTKITSNTDGNLTVLLKHYTSASPKSTGINGGSTDISVTFPLVIQ